MMCTIGFRTCNARNQFRASTKRRASGPLALLFCLLVLVFFSGLFVSCGSSPPEGTSVQPLFPFLEQYFKHSNEVQYDLAARRKFDDESEDLKVTVFIPKGNILRFKAVPPETVENDALLVCQSPATFVTRKDIYWTLDGDIPLLSLNGTDWFVWDKKKADMNENLIPRFFFSQSIDEDGKTMRISFPWQTLLNSERHYWWKNKRPHPVVNLKPGMKIAGNGFNVDLRKTTVFAPAGTVIHVRMTMLGNLVAMRTEDDEFVAEVLRDIWFFRAPGVIGMSFDGRDWSQYIWNFTLEQQYYCTVQPDSSLDFEYRILLRRN